MGDQYLRQKIACIVSMDLTDAAIDHLIFPSASDSSAGYNDLSRGSSDMAQPSAQMTENRVKDVGCTLSGV